MCLVIFVCEKIGSPCETSRKREGFLGVLVVSVEQVVANKLVDQNNTSLLYLDGG